MNHRADRPCEDAPLPIGHVAMDAEHVQFAALLGALRAAPDAALPGAFDALLAHADAHFTAEDASLTASGCPGRACHMQEHAAVLATLRGVRRRLAQGEYEVARAVASELAAWFPAHVRHLDSALSHWLSRQRHGGQPVVLHRDHRTEACPA